jgi:TPR repeat protein
MVKIPLNIDKTGAMSIKGRTIAIFALAAVVVWLGTLALALWFFRTAGILTAQAPLTSAGVSSLSASLGDSSTDTPTEAPQTITVQEALERLQAAAEAGQTSAMLDLAEFYGRGLGVKQNFSERFHWFQKAAEAGDPRGAFLAALAQETGLGTPADPAQALAGFQKAAEMGLTEAHMKLAELLLAGPEADPAKAATHLEAALDGGLPLAANILGRLYMDGAGDLKADPEKARQVLQRGADLADPEAMKNLGVMFRQGWGGPADPAQALKWFLAARDLGYQGGENMETALTDLESKLDSKAVSQAKAEAQAWLEEHRPTREVVPSSQPD